MKNLATTEELLTGILKDLLSIREINLNEHWVDLGGDSLQAIELMALLSDALHMPLSPVLPFEVDTLRQLVEQIDALRRAALRGKEAP